MEVSYLPQSEFRIAHPFAPIEHFYTVMSYTWPNPWERTYRLVTKRGTCSHYPGSSSLPHDLSQSSYARLKSIMFLHSDWSDLCLHDAIFLKEGCSYKGGK
jgi:hypothetical protein